MVTEVKFSLMRSMLSLHSDPLRSQDPEGFLWSTCWSETFLFDQICNNIRKMQLKEQRGLLWSTSPTFVASPFCVCADEMRADRLGGGGMKGAGRCSYYSERRGGWARAEESSSWMDAGGALHHAQAGERRQTLTWASAAGKTHSPLTADDEDLWGETGLEELFSKCFHLS